jgi:16S rRNA A1518/A1519 N6-dimethyltransferase RsmA/KsgA/DIM1 with predicted DNA glycosylase/AP lyase activity
VVNLDVAYIATPKKIVREMLKLADVRRGELVYDLGAGDGRILVEATRTFGARALGIEIDPERVSRMKDRLRSTGVEAEVIQGDFMSADLSRADVIAIYLSDSVNARLGPKLARELREGARVVSVDYIIPGLKAEKESEVISGGVARRIHLYRVSKRNNLHGNFGK